MAYTTGTAANYKDLLSILASFASANGWTVLRQTETELYMRGAGTEGIDRIYCGARAFENSSIGYYNWELLGSVFYKANNAINVQPQCASSVYKTYAYLWNSQITYWMFASPRRVIIVAKVATTYQHIYLGFIDPIGTASQYPYPLLVGGSGNEAGDSYSGTNLSSYWNGLDHHVGLLYMPGGSWGKLSNTQNYQSMHAADLAPRNPLWNKRGAFLTAPDGSYMLEPIYIIDVWKAATYGQLDGVYRVTGHRNNSENIITVSGMNYLVFQDAYRTSYSDYCAIRMS